MPAPMPPRPLCRPMAWPWWTGAPPDAVQLLPSPTPPFFPPLLPDRKHASHPVLPPWRGRRRRRIAALWSSLGASRHLPLLRRLLLPLPARGIETGSSGPDGRVHDSPPRSRRPPGRFRRCPHLRAIADPAMRFRVSTACRLASPPPFPSLLVAGHPRPPPRSPSSARRSWHFFSLPGPDPSLGRPRGWLTRACARPGTGLDRPVGRPPQPQARPGNRPGPTCGPAQTVKPVN